MKVPAQKGNLLKKAAKQDDLHLEMKKAWCFASPENILAETLREMDQALLSFKSGKYSEPSDLSDF